jgi:hypothetical protein
MFEELCGREVRVLQLSERCVAGKFPLARWSDWTYCLLHDYTFLMNPNTPVLSLPICSWKYVAYVFMFPRVEIPVFLKWDEWFVLFYLCTEQTREQ